MSTTLITGGTVVTATGRSEADVLIDGETIVGVLNPGSVLLGSDLASSVDHVIDAKGKYVIPGGVDAHTHMELPFGGTAASDTFETGTRAAAWGGTTTIIDFAVQTFGQKVMDGLAAWHAKAAGNCAIDYAFHQIIGEVNDDSLAAMKKLPDEGISSFKLFMAYPGVFMSDDAQIFKAMQVSADTGMMTMMHAENGPVIDVIVKQLLAQGKTDPYYHGVARAWQMEALAGGGVPQAEALVFGPAEDLSAIGGERHARDPVLMALKDAEALAGGGVPQAEGIVGGPAEDLSAIRGESHAQDVVLMALEDAEALGEGGVPQAEGQVIGAAEDLSAIRGERYAPHPDIIIAKDTERVYISVVPQA